VADDPDALREVGRLADAALGYARRAVRAAPEEAARLRLAQAECWAELGEVVRARRALEKAVTLGDRERVLASAQRHPALSKIL